MKYSESIAIWLKNAGYKVCFYVGGGNIMHLTESISKYLDCRVVVNEVAAGIAAEYYNATSNDGKALALVTAGPGLTNIVTAIAGSYLESRELLILGGQVKTQDLSHGSVRQKGIQEIDGVELVKSICHKSVRLDRQISRSDFESVINVHGRQAPVFIEIPLDVQAQVTEDHILLEENKLFDLPKSEEIKIAKKSDIELVRDLLNSSSKPVILIGGGVARDTLYKNKERIEELSIPIMTTWNGCDRWSSEYRTYLGRPNQYGQRGANFIIQQSDLLIAIGTRLGLQQTGFNWNEFVPNGKIIHIDIDENELKKENPKTYRSFAIDADSFIDMLIMEKLRFHDIWLSKCIKTKKLMPVNEYGKISGKTQFINPYRFIELLSKYVKHDDIIIPCSSGGSFVSMMQAFENKSGQKVVTNKGLASMGYGLSGAIGASLANPNKTTTLVEGDGGFAQNLQEIGTVARNSLNLKIFIIDDDGQASIRSVQRNYFSGNYIGCDTKTGLGLPLWNKLFEAWDVKVKVISDESQLDEEISDVYSSIGPEAIIVKVDPDFRYMPKVTSKVLDNGSMTSNPIDKMNPELECKKLETIARIMNE